MAGSMQADVMWTYVVYSGGGGGGGGGGVGGLHAGSQPGFRNWVPKIPKFWGILFFKGDHNNLRLQLQTCIYNAMEIILKLKKNSIIIYLKIKF